MLLGLGGIIGGSVTYSLSVSGTKANTAYREAVKTWQNGVSSIWSETTGVYVAPLVGGLAESASTSLDKLVGNQAVDIPPVTYSESDPLPTYNDRAYFSKNFGSGFFNFSGNFNFGNAVTGQMTVFVEGDNNNKVEVLSGNLAYARTTKYVKVPCRSSNSAVDAAICLASSCAGENFRLSGECQLQLRLRSMCVTIPTEITRKAREGFPVVAEPINDGIGCSSFVGDWCYSDPGVCSGYGLYEVLSGGEGTLYSLTPTYPVTVQVRAREDPFVTAIKVTDGTNSFTNAKGLYLAGVILLPIGCVSFFLAILFFTVMMVSPKNKLDKLYAAKPSLRGIESEVNIEVRNSVRSVNKNAVQLTKVV